MTYGNFDIASNLTETRHWEDGSPIYREVFSVTASTDRGDRIAHRYSFQTLAEAEALRARIEAAVKAGRTLDLVQWHPMDPVYGSEAYAQLDALGYWAQVEKMNDH
ncbi:MAG: hypothetical protein E6Q97_15680 [Desulfurellales bacterium]|nr:MAG: hypothetical protein E6Q97_15680 [Desulfurellales bacterium]